MLNLSVSFFCMLLILGLKYVIIILCLNYNERLYNMKQIKFTFILILCFLLNTSAVFSAEKTVEFDGWRTFRYNSDTWCTVNGKYVDFNSNGIPFFTYTETLPEGSVNYIPIRTVAEAMGFVIGYDEQTCSIELKSSDKILVMSENSPYAYLYDSYYQLIGNIMFTASASSETLCPVRVIESTTYVPIRAVAEAFGYYVGYSDGQIMLSLTETDLTPCEKDSVSRVINVHGLGEVRISNHPNAAGVAKFKEINNLTNLTGYLCRTREGMWISGIPESILEYYTDIIPPEYFDDIYYKSSQQSPWTKFTEEIAIHSVYDISVSMMTISVGDEVFFFSDISEVENEAYRDAFKCLIDNHGTVVKAVIDTYSADYNAIVTGQSEKSTLYRVYLPYDNVYRYVLQTGDVCRMIPPELFAGQTFAKDIAVTIEGEGNVYVYCDIIIVDIVDA